MKILLILLMAFCLAASAQVISGAEKILSVGGDFGRTWLNNYQAQKPNPTAQDSVDNLSSWGGAPKGINTSNQLSVDWLGTTTILGNSNSTKNNTTIEAAKIIPYHISKTFSPIHEIDARFNQTLQVPQLPQPDKNGFINGLPAETYYAIAPAFFDF
jgi:hypothetical protein